MAAGKTRLIVGCMTGTSLDGLDAALVRVTGHGLELKATFVRGLWRRFGPLGRLLRPLAQQKRYPAQQFARLALMLGAEHALAVKKLLAGDKADLIAAHGQTIYHRPPLSWQLLNPHPIVEQTQTPVVYDLRGADLARRGQGAPITPLADHLLYRHERETRVVLNLGGFINFTWLAPTKRRGAAALDTIGGGDICPCNQLLDALALRCFKRPYDKGGRRALSGWVSDPRALNMLVKMLFPRATGGRSLGTGDEAVRWVKNFAGRVGGTDLARIACAGIARTVAEHVGAADRYIVAGGGSRNAALMRELKQRLSPLDESDAHGVPGKYREAIAMAVLGALAQDRVPITLPQVTGALAQSSAGAWVYP